MNIVIRAILLFFGTAGLAAYLLPFFKRRILNIGNLAGLIVCTGVVAYAVFMPQLHRLIGRYWQKTAGRIALIILFSGIAVSVVLTAVMSVLMIRAARTEPSENATVVILGCKVYGERPSIMLTERMDAAISYLDAYPESVCIVSGGQGHDETISEAECMYIYLTGHGISPDRIYKEDQSTSTRENLAFSYEIIRANGLNAKIAIATNGFHEYRAGKIADALGLEHGAVPGRTALWLFPTYYTRELFGILYEWIL